MATEKRLIDANECYELADHCYSSFYHHVADLPILRNLLNNCPTVDAVEVVHGRWMPTYHTYYNRNGASRIADEWHCSECGIYSRSEWNYCPNCGANMMDGDGNG